MVLFVDACSNCTVAAAVFGLDRILSLSLNMIISALLLLLLLLLPIVDVVDESKRYQLNKFHSRAISENAFVCIYLISKASPSLNSYFCLVYHG